MMVRDRASISFTEGLALKAVSVLIALILWITILGFKQEELKLDVKLQPVLAPGMMVTNRIPSRIQFTFSGPRFALNGLERRLEPIRPDLRRTPETTIGFSVSEELLSDLPQGVRVMGFFPSNFLIRLEEVIERYVPVKPVFSGRPALGYELDRVISIPQKVAVSGPRGPIQSLEGVATEPIDIEGLRGDKEAVSTVEVEGSQGFQLSREKMVRVKLRAKKVTTK